MYRLRIFVIIQLGFLVTYSQRAVKTDTFESCFFEAVKHSAIGQHNRAIGLLNKCENTDSDNKGIIAYLLGKSHQYQQNYTLAQTYYHHALLSNPKNIWYAHSYWKLLDKQGKGNQAIEELENLANKNRAYKPSLANIYAIAGDFKKAIKKAQETKDKELKRRIELHRLANINTKKVKQNPVQNPLIVIYAEINELISQKNYNTLLQKAKDAVETYPSKPYFYYAYGLALNNTNQTEEAIYQFLSAIDFVSDKDEKMTKDIYKELAKAYKKTGNKQKMTIYLNKSKQ